MDVGGGCGLGGLGGGGGGGDTGFFSNLVFLMGKVGSGVDVPQLLLLWASKRFRVIRGKATDSSVFIGLFAADTAVADPDDEHGSLAEAEQAEAETAATAH